MTAEIKPGDLVVLKSGSVKMTVSKITNADDRQVAHCVYSNQHSGIASVSLDVLALKHYDPNDTIKAVVDAIENLRTVVNNLVNDDNLKQTKH